MRRLRTEDGFGLTELLIAMTLLAIGVSALVAALSSAHVSLVRAGKITTASALAASQIETYRSLRHTEITLSDAATDAVYSGDVAYPGTRVVATPCTEIQCEPSRLATGADGKSYRVDTYIVSENATSAVVRQVKKITVVVRNPGAGNRVLARQTTAFDALTEG